ncbi:hypothetical protein ACGFX4_12215 [Kitasatospora sp. NPDC048365]|uniref:Uncharacterized protein n=1 Tax=Kitasatospora terrestris TaxID=258051 RepID=A0ABP9EKJ4_9ACTN
MVAPVENLTTLHVRVASLGPHPRLGDWDLASAEVLSAEPVSGRADLLSQYVGRTVQLGIPRRLTGGLHPGSGLTLRARLATGDILAEPNPGPGDFTVDAG